MTYPNFLGLILNAHLINFLYTTQPQQLPQHDWKICRKYSVVRRKTMSEKADSLKIVGPWVSAAPRVTLFTHEVTLLYLWNGVTSTQGQLLKTESTVHPSVTFHLNRGRPNDRSDKRERQQVKRSHHIYLLIDGLIDWLIERKINHIEGFSLRWKDGNSDYIDHHLCHIVRENTDKTT